jgi:outer membrane lipoprotein-sorting protein
MTIPIPGRRAGTLAALLSLAGAAWSAAPTTGILQYETDLVIANQPPRKMAQKIWFKGEKFRIQNDTPMGSQVTVGGPSGVFVMMPGSKEAMKLPNKKPVKKGVPGLPFGDMARFKNQKKVGTQKIGSYMTNIYEQDIDVNMPGAAQKGTTRTWVTDSLPVPVKVVTKMPPNFQTTTVLKSVKLNAPVADSLFELPKGMKIRTQPSAPSGGPPAASPH